MLKERENVIVSATEPTGKDREKVWLQHKNILFQNSDEWQQGTISSESGTIVDSTTRIRTSNFIEVESNTEHIFTINNNNCKFLIFEYTSDETFIKSTDWITSAKYKYITSETGHKIKIIISHTDNSTIETSEISTIKLNLSNTQSKIYVLNDNNVYEEFVPNEDKIVRNSNGTAIKFANGMMICTIDTLIGTYNDASKTYIASWTFPVAFVKTPIYCGGTVFAGNSKAYSVTAVGLSNTSVYIHTKCLGANGTVETCDRSANCIAIGRWK